MLAKNLEMSLHKALTIARDLCHEYATLEHLLLALVEDPDAYRIMQRCGVDTQLLTDKLQHFLAHDLIALVIENITESRPTTGFQRVIHRAAISANASGSDTITGANVLLEILGEQESYAAFFLAELGVGRQDILRAMEKMTTKTPDRHSTLPPYSSTASLRSGTGQNQGQERIEFNAPKTNSYVTPPKEDKNISALEKYCVNLNRQAKLGKIDDLIGRNEEVRRTIEVLSKRTKNNPLYVGEPGVGKTAIAEGLAMHIVHQKVPSSLANTVIYALDMGSLLAGTRYRGDFEERIKQVIQDIEQQPSAVLFIDEIHIMVGAGATSGGSMDASNLFKPALARGQFRCIGATTFKEYSSHFEKDQALARRFQKIIVEEPSVNETITILRGIRNYYEHYHRIVYSDAALSAAATLADRYLHNRCLPDKAIDVIDEAGAYRRIRHADNDTDHVAVLDVDDIKQTVARMSHLPVESVGLSETDRLRALGPRLQEKIFGQSQAIEELCSAVKLSRAGLRDHRRPLGSYLFSGPTGVGKTELAKQFASIMEMELIRFDMSEYMEQHAASKLIGTPPGYVGFDQGGLLTDAVANHPYAVVLLDEIEKANYEICNLLLQIMDYGVLKDHHGKMINFSHCVIIMTTNIGAETYQTSGFGFGGDAQSSRQLEAIRAYFSPEFMNRLDAVIPFSPLARITMDQVVYKFMEELRLQLSEKGMMLQCDDAVYDYLSSEGYSPIYGARPLGRLIQEKIKKPLADKILFEPIASGSRLTLRMKDGEIALDCSMAIVQPCNDDA